MPSCPCCTPLATWIFAFSAGFSVASRTLFRQLGRHLRGVLARSRGSDLQAPAGGIQGHLGKTHVCNRGGHLLASRCKKPLHVRTPVAVSRDSWASLVVQRRSMIVPVCHSRWVGVDCGAPPERGSLRQPGRQSQDDPRSSTRSRSHHGQTAPPRALAALFPGVLAIPEEGWQHETPPRKLLEGRGSREAWLRFGVCRGARLPRGRCSGRPSLSAQWISAALKSSLKGSLSFTGFNSRSTPPWCRHSVLMAHRRCPDEDGAALTFAGGARSAPIQSSQVVQVVPNSSSLRGRQEVVSRRRRRPFSDLLAGARTRSTPKVLRARARQFWLHPMGLHPLLCNCPGLRMLVAGSAWQWGADDGDVPSVSDVLSDFCKAPIAD